MLLFRWSLFLIMNETVRPLKILIADDHAILRERLVQILTEEFPSIYIGEAIDTLSLINQALAEDWDMIISDISMPGEGGIKALRQIKKAKPAVPVLMVSTHPYDPYAKEAIALGAAGYLNKQDIPLHLVDIVQQIITSGFYTTLYHPPFIS